MGGPAEPVAPGVSATMPEGMDALLTVVRLTRCRCRQAYRIGKLSAASEQLGVMPTAGQR